MKNFLKILIVATAFLAVSCDSSTVGHKVAAIGGQYEVLVICSQDKWDSPLGDSLRAVMLQPVEGISQVEPLYDVMRILPNQFTGMLQKNRNVLNIVSNPEYTEPMMFAQYDVYAAPQLIATVAGPDDASLTEYISEHRDELVAIFEIAERDRDLSNASRFNEKKIEEQIKDKFGFDMHLLKGYKVRNSLDDFMWISFEYPTASQGVVIYSYPYTGPENFTADSLVANRNRFVSRIPADNPGSYMTTFDGFVPELAHKRIHGRYWAEMRGFWDVAGDFMGGPFVSYSTLDVETRRVVTLDFYVYSPDKPKRNFLRGLEHLVFSVSFPGDAEAGGAEE